MNQQVISKQRVTDHGEVYTNAREVNAMLDLVKAETERIDSRFLEPACGNGNFLAEVLRRKLAVVAARHGTHQLDYERYAVLAVSSIYGIDILPDNIEACRRRLFDLFEAGYASRFKASAKDECRASVRFILALNIICGDALTLQTVGDGPAQPIVFAQWSLVNDSQFKRLDFVYDHLVELSTPPTEDDLFSPCNVQRTVAANGALQQSDAGDYSYHVSPVKDYPLVHFLRLADVV